MRRWKFNWNWLPVVVVLAVAGLLRHGPVYVGSAVLFGVLLAHYARARSPREEAKGAGDGTAHDGTVPLLDSPEGVAALNTLTPIERRLFKRAIRRQFARPNLMTARLPKYGLTGAVHFSSGTAFQWYAPMLTLLVVLPVSFTVSGAPAVLCLLATIPVWGCAIRRSCTASRLGEEWRASQSDTAQDPGAQTEDCSRRTSVGAASPVVFRPPTTGHKPAAGQDGRLGSRETTS